MAVRREEATKEMILDRYGRVVVPDTYTSMGYAKQQLPIKESDVCYNITPPPDYWPSVLRDQCKNH